MTRGTTTEYARPVSARAAATTQTKALLACGIVGGPLFFVVAMVQMVIRPGFDLRRHAISLLSLGDLGWIQIANFLVTGVLAILCAIGLRRLPRGGIGDTWGPLLIGGAGLGILAGGIFHPDPGLSFPPGAPAGMPTTMSWHASVHMLAFSASVLCLLAACFVFARRFRANGLPGWGMYCVATAVVSLLLIGLSMSDKNLVGVFMAAGVAVAFAWVAAIAARSLSEAVPDSA
jgi:hypothetical membrane protein